MRIIPVSTAARPNLAPDIGWNGVAGDLVLSDAQDRVNPSSFRAEQPLETAVLICLMTDRRVDATELRDGDVNRGWPGDAFDLDGDETPLGSKLWLLRRAALLPGIELKAEDYAREALQTLIDQGAFARFDVTATADRTRNRLDLDVAGYGRDGAKTYQKKFALLWESVESAVGE